MDSQEPVFDNIKFEKAKAMARFNRFRKITKFLQLFLEVFVTLLLISWSSTRLPGALKMSCRILIEVANYVFNPHVVFVIGNVIIVALFVLCRENNSGNENSGDGDIYDDYVRHSEAHAQQRKVSVSDRDGNPAPELQPTPEIKDVIAGSGCGDDEAEEEEEKKIVCVYSEEKSEKCDEVTTAIEKAGKQIEKFERTQSEKLKREIAANHRSELQRSETVNVNRTERPAMTSLDTVDKLSNEEFNLTIEAFIKRHQKFLMEQKLAENDEMSRKN